MPPPMSDTVGGRGTAEEVHADEAESAPHYSSFSECLLWEGLVIG